MPLPGFDGARPVELNSRNTLAPVESTPYRLMLGAYDVYWLQLTRERSASDVVLETGDGPAIRTDRLKLPLTRYDATQLAHALQPYVARQRWFGDRARTITDTTVVDAFELAPGEDGGSPSWGVGVQMEFDTGESSRYITVLHRADGSGTTRSSTPPSPVNWPARSCAAASIPGGRGSLRGQPAAAPSGSTGRRSPAARSAASRATRRTSSRTAGCSSCSAV